MDPGQLKQSNIRDAVRGKSEEIENWVFIEFQSPERHYIYPEFRALGKKKKKKSKQAKLYKEDQTSGAGLGAEGE